MLQLPAGLARRATWPAALGCLLAASGAAGHGIEGADQEFLLNNVGPNIGPYLYLGAKHLVTGYDHLLFLAGVIFFLYKLRDVALYVTLFAVGHSATLLIGVLGGLHVNPYIVDAIIGFSVVYKAFENLNGFSKLGFHPDTRAAVFVFGLFHGFGLATKLQDLAISPDGLVVNMVSFNVGVEIGQFIALALILVAFNLWRRSGSFLRHAQLGNMVLMCAGFLLMGYQISGYFLA
ncbi:MAG TPA: HupE/UreJ family protein [Gammaproteobacteria bacterium]|nr:HupE/UreJ family protein [Gammaproteobacteria bacterium]